MVSLPVESKSTGVLRPTRSTAMPQFPRSATSPPWLPLACAIAALALAATGVAASALWWPGFSHASHPLALPGAGGVPGAGGYNLLVFVVPGLLAALLAEWRYAALQASAGWGPRIGARLLLVAAVAWAAQGVFTLDLHELDGPDGQLHAAAWTCWWLAGSSGLLLLGAGVAGALTYIVRQLGRSEESWGNRERQGPAPPV